MIDVVVTGIEHTAPDVRVLRLRRADGAPFAPVEPGAHVDVLGPTGLVRQYSLCGDPARTDGVSVGVKRDPSSRGGSRALHELVQVGSTLRIGAPRNLFPLDRTARRHVLVGAGIGVTPMVSMAHRLHADGASFALHQFARSREDAPFARELAAAAFADRVRLHTGVPRPDLPALVDRLLAEAGEGAHLYVCGPGGFQRTVVETARCRLPADAVHVELFRPPEPTDDGGDGFELALDTGEVFEVPAGRSIVDVLGDNGITVDTSCREGICGTCVLQVLEGVPDHRDHCLTRREKEAGDQIAACVSRARSARLVVEV